MAKLTFDRPHKLGLDRARDAMQRVADEMSESYSMHCEWNGDVLQFRRSGVRGEVTVTDTDIAVDAKLGPLLAAFRPRIEERLSENFDKYFA